MSESHFLSRIKNCLKAFFFRRNKNRGADDNNIIVESEIKKSDKQSAEVAKEVKKS